VNPGFGGQKFIPSTLKKIEELAKLKRENCYNYEIEIDGGVTLDNIEMIRDKGCEIFVAGSAVFKSDDIVETTKKFKQF